MIRVVGLGDRGPFARKGEFLEARLLNQIAFIKEIDKLKSVLRMSTLIDGSRRENTAEHSWHLGLMAAVLEEHSDDKLDISRTIRMALVHDIVEIDAGDTYCYDESAHADKEEREKAAADRIFALLPQDQGEILRPLWDEFEEGHTAEAKFARAVDRLSPFMLNFYSGGEAWIKNGIKKSQALGRMGEIKTNVPKLWPYVQSLLSDAMANGWIIDDD